MRLWSSVLLRRLELVSVFPLTATASGNLNALTLRALATRPRKAWPSLAPTPDPRPAIACTDRGSPTPPPRLSRGDCRGRSILLTINRTDQATTRERGGRWRE